MAAWTARRRNTVIVLLGVAVIALATVTIFGDVIALALAGLSNLNVEFGNG